MSEFGASIIRTCNNKIKNEKKRLLETEQFNLNIMQSAEAWWTQKSFLLLIVLHFFGHICCHVKEKLTGPLNTEHHWIIKKMCGKKTILQTKLMFSFYLCAFFIPHIEFGLWICVYVYCLCWTLNSNRIDRFKPIPNMDDNVNTEYEWQQKILFFFSPETQSTRMFNVYTK